MEVKEMYEIGDFIRHQDKGAKLVTAIQRYPSGKYGFVGGIPIELTHESESGTPQWPPVRVSNVYETEQEAIQALLDIGITRFQLSDCSWCKSTTDES